MTRALAKFRSVPAPRIVVDTVGGTCATCRGPIAAGSRVHLSYVRDRSPGAYAVAVTRHEACALVTGSEKNA